MKVLLISTLPALPFQTSSLQASISEIKPEGHLESIVFEVEKEAALRVLRNHFVTLARELVTEICVNSVFIRFLFRRMDNLRYQQAYQYPLT